MKVYEIDGKLIAKDGHKYLKKALDFPDYYGENLDALYDCLCELNCEIHIKNVTAVKDCILDTFDDARMENENLIIKFI
ncbi:MAG: barstar family protein [Methanobrevibacter sp.]|nr:barstar family protein [Methanobrevibacter sp.]